MRTAAMMFLTFVFGFIALVALVFLLMVQANCQEVLPSMPDPQKDAGRTVCIGVNSCGWRVVAKLPPPPVTFFTFRSKWQDPPLRTNKQVLKSSAFWLSQGALWLTVIPRGKNGWHVMPIEAAGITALDYASDRLFCECFAVAPPAYAVIRWIRGR